MFLWVGCSQEVVVVGVKPPPPHPSEGSGGLWGDQPPARVPPFHGTTTSPTHLDVPVEILEHLEHGVFVGDGSRAES